MAKARPAEGELGSMTRSVAERVIYEANLGAEDTKIARMYYAVVYAWAGIKKRRSMTSVFYLLLHTCTTMNAL